MNTSLHTYICMHICICIYIYIYTHLLNACTHTYCVHRDTLYTDHTRVQKSLMHRIHVYVHTYTHMQTHTQTHTTFHICTRMYTYTCENKIPCIHHRTFGAEVQCIRMEKWTHTNMRASSASTWMTRCRITRNTGVVMSLCCCKHSSSNATWCTHTSECFVSIRIQEGNVCTGLDKLLHVQSHKKHRCSQDGVLPYLPLRLHADKPFLTNFPTNLCEYDQRMQRHFSRHISFILPP